ncbi:MAG: 4Fe-4S ferredoxin [Caldiserica bacterium]|nr:MAG: 4Fe-4S ferredoxin [Caldisericota bacterium]
MKKVYFLPWNRRGEFDKFLRLKEFTSLFSSKDYVAIKIHFGEEGNKGFVEPEFVKKIVERIKRTGSFPFLTDSNTIYLGSRHDAYHHLKVAYEHGFSIENLGVPVIIGDGLRGECEEIIELNGTKYIKKASIGKIIMHSDKIVFVSHFKGHECMGFGGALKNIGMGCATRKGKYEMHAEISPKINLEKCSRCRVCGRVCLEGAISYDKDGYPLIDSSKCSGCGMCIIACPQGAIKIPWDDNLVRTQEKMIEYCFAILKERKEEVCFFNFLKFITKYCDCYRTREKPLIEDIGILFSLDPVAIDRASIDIINERYGKDFFKDIWPEIDWKLQLDYAEELGIGTQRYELVNL